MGAILVTFSPKTTLTRVGANIFSMIFIAIYLFVSTFVVLPFLKAFEQRKFWYGRQKY
ncbi:hypothetical protein MNBD_ALPHA11-727 [hydrothermal vent metagenome]|uniref:Uncharacterized protein n=1 Tax=hydrothermal vent metagenome TaxID=652676 RepID=A0A3B0UQF9_9ZZZZ